jgi:RimJ/RimL family protein N-acetyltransferase
MINLDLRLEELEIRHAPKLFAALNDDRVGKFIGGPDVTTLVELQERILHLLSGPPNDSNQRWFNFVVILEAEVIGRVEATSHDGITEIAYLINPSHWDRGFATSATELLLEDLRKETEFNFWATVDPNNSASIRVLEKLGFSRINYDTAPLLLSYDEGDKVFQLNDQVTN